MQFNRDGIRFDYPENWQLTSEAADTGWTVSVQSPDTAFFLLTLDEGMPEIGDVVHFVVAAIILRSKSSMASGATAYACAIAGLARISASSPGVGRNAPPS